MPTIHISFSKENDEILSNIHYLHTYLASQQSDCIIFAGHSYPIPDDKSGTVFISDCDLICHQCSKNTNSWHITAINPKKQLGAGAEGTVYRGTSYQILFSHLRESAPKAVKVYSPSVSPQSPKKEQDFNKLIHGGARSPVKSSPPTSPTTVFVAAEMKFHEGIALDKFLHNDLSLDERLKLCILILEAYEEQILNKGIVHLDLKPSNMIYQTSPESDKIIIIDAGSCEYLDGKAKRISPGTEKYHALEQLEATPIVPNTGIAVFTLGRIIGEILKAPAITEEIDNPIRYFSLICRKYGYEDVLSNYEDVILPEHRAAIQAILQATTDENCQARPHPSSIKEALLTVLTARVEARLYTRRTTASPSSLFRSLDRLPGPAPRMDMPAKVRH